MKIFYHKNCHDGMAAAAVAHLALGDMLPQSGEEIAYIPVQYGDLVPPTVKGETIYILDFSWPRGILTALGKTNPVTVIDHHKTAAGDLAKPIPGVHTIFDMHKCGAVLAWEFFHPGKDLPALLRFVQDRDLWLWQYPETRAIHYGLGLLPWREWFAAMADHDALTRIQVDGAAIAAFLDQQAEKVVQAPPVRFFTGHTVPVYNLPGFMISETLALALSVWPEAPFAVAVMMSPEKLIYSLRSRPGSKFDVSELARQHGGGGHKHAAGFTVPLNQPEPAHA